MLWAKLGMPSCNLQDLSGHVPAEPSLAEVAAPGGDLAL